MSANQWDVLVFGLIMLAGIAVAVYLEVSGGRD